jgi:hypothetical protein
MSTPFVIMALPRSRTAWLAKFLSYGTWYCGHDQLKYARSIDDVKTWLSIPEVGTVETAASSHWRLAINLCPSLRIVTIRRRRLDVLDSLERLNGELKAFGLNIDRERIIKVLAALDRKLDQVEYRVSNVTRIEYSELSTMEGLKKVWQATLPYPFDAQWASAYQDINIQIPFGSEMRYMIANHEQLKTLAKIAKATTVKIMSSRKKFEIEGITIKIEPDFDQFLVDGQDLFSEHSMTVGEPPDSWMTKNLRLFKQMSDKDKLVITVATSNGRMFGYLVTILGPSFEAEDRLAAVHTAFYASPLFHGLGLRLQRAAMVELRRRGVKETWWREAPRSAKVGVYARRMGAVPDGQLYRLME